MSKQSEESGGVAEDSADQPKKIGPGCCEDGYRYYDDGSVAICAKHYQTQRRRLNRLRSPSKYASRVEVECGHPGCLLRFAVDFDGRLSTEVAVIHAGWGEHLIHLRPPRSE